MPVRLAGRGVGVSAIVFWLLLQFTRALRAMRMAGQSPVGQVPSVVMCARMRTGMRLLDVIQLTRALGERALADPRGLALERQHRLHPHRAPEGRPLHRLDAGAARTRRGMPRARRSRPASHDGAVGARKNPPFPPHPGDLPSRCPTATARSGWTARWSTGATRIHRADPHPALRLRRVSKACGRTTRSTAPPSSACSEHTDRLFNSARSCA